jgi:hypothetical protein
VTSSVTPMENPQADFVDQTLRVWQQRSSRQLAPEDARQITENVSGFFRLLNEWDRERANGARRKMNGQHQTRAKPEASRRVEGR